ncbi:Lambda-carrageenase precursor [Planctomycetes bacterium CA13]|uniref:Lambda-carrageenase n=1 Tax=Novipirellula herctigrandis TaxID=2527986 RepID=A0A5C5Z1J4_9BACT|nr:Lambda-carrageenase precursor [Planctomycetes bacterium CA13]
MFILVGLTRSSFGADGVTSIETGYTVSKVRTALIKGNSYVVASSYEGTVFGIAYSGRVGWENKLSGYMNHDLWCEDITGDGTDEILVANADGHLYCLNSRGELQWTFKKNDAPMYAVCVLHHQAKTYVVCGGYDNHIYYLSPVGDLVKDLPSLGYSVSKPWGNDPHKPSPPKKLHVANFLRKIKNADGTESLVVHGMMNGMQDKGVLYLFEPLADKPWSTIPLESKSPMGELRVCEVEGKSEILMGASSMIHDASVAVIDAKAGDQRIFGISSLGRKLDSFGYRVAQPEVISSAQQTQYFVLFGSRILLLPTDLDKGKTEVLVCRYSFNDMWKDPLTHRIVFASAQSGGSCIHILDPNHPDWKTEYENLSPPGKIATILENTAMVREQLKTFKRPAWERDPLPVYLMSENRKTVEALVEELRSSYGSPVFLNGFHMGTAEDWDRSAIESEKYRDRRDRRRKYSLTQDQALEQIVSHYDDGPGDDGPGDDGPGIAYWAGHGNDPYMFSLDTTKKVIAAANGKKTVLIYPELEDHSPEFEYVMDDLIYPLADAAKGKNANIFVRTKHVFWQGNVYLPAWKHLLSGEYADVFVPSMEETTDKSMELSLAARLGIWTSGAVNSWGGRCARDNASYDRARQHSHQMLPNHFLRMMVYDISHGTQYLDNFSVDQQYMSLLWELIAKGALYVPKREEIVSFSPVHISMKKPDETYIERGSNTKWCTFFDQDFEDKNPMVFGRLNGSWPGAPNTPWDFSRYAAGVKDRRLNFLPPYDRGLVLITPPQQGVFADSDAPRGQLKDHLHPLYKNILKEFITDGRQYFSPNGKKHYAANAVYQTVESEIRNRSKLLPLTVTGDVAWVVAQSSPTHLRLTLVDSGYINPSGKTASVSFHSVKPMKMTDVVSGASIDISDPSSVNVDVPCGLFRFVDVELVESL